MLKNKITKLKENYSKEDFDKIQRAYKFAVKVHVGQKRKNGKPYTEHLLEVAFKLVKWKQDADVLSAALLHDVIEDRGISLKRLKKEFGNKIANLVDGMSWIVVKRKGKLKKDPDLTYKKFARFAKKDFRLILIRSADMLSNLSQYKVEDKLFVSTKIYKRNKEFYIPLFRQIGMNKIADRIEKVTDKYRKDKIPVLVGIYLGRKDIKDLRTKLKPFID